MLEELKVKISVDLKELEDGLKKSEKQLGEVGASLKDLGGKLTVGVSLPLLAVGAASVKMAMDVVESENLFEVSMKGMAQEARNFSVKLRDQLGLNEFETRKNVGTFYNMFEAMKLGSQSSFKLATGLTLLANDMASFYNLNPQDAFDKLRAGITGEAEPLKRLGILVDENTVKRAAYTHGIAQNGMELTNNQKVMARYLAIMDQTKTAQGDLARTIDSPTNQLRLLGSQFASITVSLGQGLMPYFQGFLVLVKYGVSVLKNLVDTFNGLSPVMKTVIVVTLAIAAAIGPILTVLGTLLLTIKMLLPLLAAMSAGLWETAAAWIAAAAPIILVVALAGFLLLEWKKMWGALKGIFLGMAMGLLKLFELYVKVMAKMASFVPALRGQAKEAVGIAEGWSNDVETAFIGVGSELDNTAWKTGGAFKAIGDAWSTTVKGLKAGVGSVQGAFGGLPGALTTPLSTTEQMWADWTQSQKIKVTDLATTINQGFNQMAVDMLTALTTGTQSAADVFFTFLQRSLEAVAGYVITNMGLFQWLAKAIVAALGNPWIALGVIAVGMAAVAALKNSYHPMATGGIVTGPTQALVGEAGPEAVIPLSNPRASKFIDGLGGGGNQTIQVVLDGRVIAESTARNLPGVLKLQGTFR